MRKKPTHRRARRTVPSPARIRSRDVKVRRARPSDKRAVLAFCRRTWGEYGDYMDRVWDQWLGDKRGFFAVASLGGRPVGTAKLTVLRPGEIWFEGLRVDPALRGTGLSHVLTAFLIKKAEQSGARSIRYATSGRNLASQHIGKRWGFRLLRKYVCFEARPDGRRANIFSRPSGPLETLEAIAGTAARKATSIPAPVRSPKKAALGLLAQAMHSSGFLTAMKGLASKGWTFYSVDEDFLERAFRRRGVFLAGRGPAPTGLLVVALQPRMRRLLVATLADWNQSQLTASLAGARRLAHDFGLGRVRVVVPYSRRMRNAATRAGYHPEYEGFSCVVMEKLLP